MLPWYVAVIVVVPALTPVTTPEVDTVATVVFDDCHVEADVTFCDEAPVEKTANAAYCDVAPITGGDPLIDKEVITVDGSVGSPLQAAPDSNAPRINKNVVNRVRIM